MKKKFLKYLFFYIALFINSRCLYFNQDQLPPLLETINAPKKESLIVLVVQDNLNTLMLRDRNSSYFNGVVEKDKTPVHLGISLIFFQDNLFNEFRRSKRFQAADKFLKNTYDHIKYYPIYDGMNLSFLPENISTFFAKKIDAVQIKDRKRPISDFFQTRASDHNCSKTCLDDFLKICPLIDSSQKYSLEELANLKCVKDRNKENKEISNLLTLLGAMSETRWDTEGDMEKYFYDRPDSDILILGFTDYSRIRANRWNFFYEKLSEYSLSILPYYANRSVSTTMAYFSGPKQKDEITYKTEISQWRSIFLFPLLPFFPHIKEDSLIAENLKIQLSDYFYNTNYGFVNNSNWNEEIPPTWEELGTVIRSSGKTIHISTYDRKKVKIGETLYVGKSKDYPIRIDLSSFHFLEGESQEEFDFRPGDPVYRFNSENSRLPID